MQALKNVWEPVKLQTGWQLEPCSKPITTSTTSATIPQNTLQNATHELSATETDNTLSIIDAASASNACDHDSLLGEGQPGTQPSPTQ